MEPERSQRLEVAIESKSRRCPHCPLCWARYLIQSSSSLNDEAALSSSIAVSTVVKASGSESGVGDLGSSTMGAAEEALVGGGGVLELPEAVALGRKGGMAGGTLKTSVGSWMVPASVHASGSGEEGLLALAGGLPDGV